MISAGFLGFVGDLLSGGGGDGGGYVSPNLRDYESRVSTGTRRRASLGFKPLTGQIGISQATQGFHLNNPQKRADELGQQSAFEQFNPYSISYKKLPALYTTQAYERGAGSLRREATGNLEATRNLIGARRPALLKKAASDQQRELNEQLAKLRTDLELKRMEKDVDLDKSAIDKQLDVLESQDSARRNRLTAGAEAGLNAARTRSDIVERERDYRDRAMDYLMQLYEAATGQANARADRATQRRGQTLGMLGDAGRIIAGAG